MQSLPLNLILTLEHMEAAGIILSGQLQIFKQFHFNMKVIGGWHVASLTDLILDLHFKMQEDKKTHFTRNIFLPWP